MSLNPHIKRQIAISLAMGDSEAAARAASKAQSRDPSKKPEEAFSRALFAVSPAPVPSPAPKAAQRFLSPVRFQKGELQYAKFQLDSSMNERYSEKSLSVLSSELHELAKSCYRNDTYSVLISLPHPGKPQQVITERLDYLRDRGIEYDFVEGGSFLEAYNRIAPVECHFTVFSKLITIKQRACYGPDVFLAELTKGLKIEDHKTAGNFRAEAKKCIRFLKGKSLIFLVRDKNTPRGVLNDIKDISECYGTKVYFFGVGGALLADKNPRYYRSFLRILSDISRRASLPAIRSPEEGWKVISHPEYRRQGEYFCINGLRGARSTSLVKLTHDLRALAQTADKERLCFDLQQCFLTTQEVIEIYKELHQPLEKNGGILALLQRSSQIPRELAASLGLNLCDTEEEVSGIFRLHYPKLIPSDGFLSITRPRRISENSEVLQCGLNSVSVANNEYLGTEKRLLSELSTALNSGLQGLILDLDSIRLPTAIFRSLANLSNIHYDADFAVVSSNRVLAEEYQRQLKRCHLLFHKNLDEAKLELEYQISPPAEGWKMFELEYFHSGFKCIIAKPQAGELKNTFIHGTTPVEFRVETARLAQRELPVILDLSDTPGYMGSNIVISVYGVQEKMRKANCRFAVVSKDRTLLTLGGVQNVHLTLSEAINSLKR